MGKKDKLLQKVMSGSKNIRFDELRLLLESFGFVLKRITGSHHIYKHPLVAQLLSIQPASDGKAKLYQIRQFLQMIETYSLQMNDEVSEEDMEENEE